MLYREYQTAAEKHLKACKATLSMLATENFNSILKNKEKEYLLMDIYYLSGYIFECTIIYAIYKKAFEFHGCPPFDETKDIKDNYAPTTFYGQGGAYYHNPPDIKFAFYKKYCDKRHSNTPNLTADYFVHGHKFWLNIDLLNSKILTGNTIPLISDRDFPNATNQAIYDLIETWKPEKRYQIENPALTFAEVNAIVSLANEVYIKVTKEVGI